MGATLERFFKYHGLGNDFVVLDRRQGGGDIDGAAARAWCDRRRGVGADGVLVILPAPGAAGRMVVHNADGSLAEMCGNGVRCVARHLAEQDGARPRALVVETGAGPKTCALEWDGAAVASVTVDMGPATFDAPHLPRGPGGGPFVDQPVGGVRGTAVSLGNPHLVLWDVDPSRAGVLGPALEHDPLFPERTNVELCSLEPDGTVRVVVWERGSGLTLACGTGACAAAAVAVERGLRPAGTWLDVALPGGVLGVKIDAGTRRAWLRGPAARVFEGSLSP